MSTEDRAEGESETGGRSEGVSQTDLIAMVVQDTGLRKSDVQRALSVYVEIIGARLAEGKRVNIRGLGTFEVKETAARNGSHPITKKPITIAASRRVAFRSSKQLKQTV